MMLMGSISIILPASAVQLLMELNPGSRNRQKAPSPAEHKLANVFWTHCSSSGTSRCKCASHTEDPPGLWWAVRLQLNPWAFFQTSQIHITQPVLMFSPSLKNQGCGVSADYLKDRCNRLVHRRTHSSQTVINILRDWNFSPRRSGRFLQNCFSCFTQRMRSCSLKRVRPSIRKG